MDNFDKRIKQTAKDENWEKYINEWFESFQE